MQLNRSRSSLEQFHLQHRRQAGAFSSMPSSTSARHTLGAITPRTNTSFIRSTSTSNQLNFGLRVNQGVTGDTLCGRYSATLKPELERRSWSGHATIADDNGYYNDDDEDDVFSDTNLPVTVVAQTLVKEADKPSSSSEDKTPVESQEELNQNGTETISGVTVGCTTATEHEKVETL